MFTFEFFSELSLIGYFGLFLWFVLPIIIIATYSDYDKNRWFMDFDDRFPKFNFIDELIVPYGNTAIIVWLFVRLFLMEAILVAIGFIFMLF